MLLALHKPYGVLSQFTPDRPGQRTLAESGLPPGVYPLGRLDRDSEGLLLLSDEPGLNTELLDPSRSHRRTYWVQVDGGITESALLDLRAGIVIGGRRTLPAEARIIHPEIPPREPPVRFRKSIPTSWIELELREGRNRQVRRMTAAAGFPTLRLLRIRIGRFDLPANLPPGHWRELHPDERASVFA
ncbi:MAG: pseudouridine synthase [Chthoniobacterales bacterium]|nr:pseudouridine synthase [Chthoniobacterales bacterium]